VPIYAGLPFGHVPDKLTLPVGGQCAFEALDGTARLHLYDYRP
jgi:muramoyltetrapeptide carboxypeptidase